MTIANHVMMPRAASKEKVLEQDLPDHPLAEILTGKTIDISAVRDVLTRHSSKGMKVDLNRSLSLKSGLPPPLFYAVGLRSSALVELFIEFGADVRSEYSGTEQWKGISQGMTPVAAAVSLKQHFSGTVLEQQYEAVEQVLRQEPSTLRRLVQRSSRILGRRRSSHQGYTKHRLIFQDNVAALEHYAEVEAMSTKQSPEESFLVGL